ncbi:MAG: hypothetical protein F6K47_17265 [Symploca sp. SIO2E6]|nr:hypothetical protein [Symploca sp. SIO2E6]
MLTNIKGTKILFPSALEPSALCLVPTINIKTNLLKGRWRGGGDGGISQGVCFLHKMLVEVRQGGQGGKVDKEERRNCILRSIQETHMIEEIIHLRKYLYRKVNRQ